MKTRIAELRKQHKLSQEELANAVGVTRQNITSIEVEKYMNRLEECVKSGDATEEEIKDVLSILKPKQIQNMASNADVQTLQAFLPFLDEDDVAELAKEAKENGQQFTMYLPFMDDEVIAEWAREDRKNGRNIAMYLPFMDEDDVADMAKEALQQGRNITDYLPFMDEDDVKDLLMMVIQNKNK